MPGIAGKRSVRILLRLMASVILERYLPICAVEGGDEPAGAALLGAVTAELHRAGLRPVRLPAHALEQRRARWRACIESDLVLVDGPTPATCRLLVGDIGTGAALPGQTVIGCRGEQDMQASLSALYTWLGRCTAATPARGCVLIGGRSSRMGQPKHLLPAGDGRTWLERTVSCIIPFVSDCLLSGRGEIPASCAGLTRVDDLPGVCGPLAGIGAVLRYEPPTSWVISACDMPDLDGQAVEWLLTQRQPGRVAVIPRNPLSGRSEPLLAWYDFRCLPLVEQLVADETARVSALCGLPGVWEPAIPDRLVNSWRNVNRAEELKSKR